MAGRKKNYEERAEALLTPIAAEHGVRVYDVEFVKEGQDFYLNCYIDKDGGVNIQDCEDVSRQMSDALDREDFITVPYTLIVSSPGLGRTLTKDRHFAQSIGQEVEGTTFRPLDGKKLKDFRGVLKEFDADTITLEQEDGKSLVLDRSNIAKVRLTIDF